MTFRRPPMFSFCAVILAFAGAQPASACFSVDALDHHILPTIPKVIERDAIVLEVLLKRMPDWNKQMHDEATVSVLRVIKGAFVGENISLALRPRSSCDVVGVIGRPGYVVLRHYPSGWIISAYHVENGRATSRGSVVTPS